MAHINNDSKWVITEDVIGEGVPNSLHNPGASGGILFRIFDDDGYLYYRGRSYIGKSFAPLDWAMAHAGATEIRYRVKDTGKWETL